MMIIVNITKTLFSQRLNNDDFYYNQTNIELIILSVISKQFVSNNNYDAKIIYCGYYGSTLYNTAIEGSDLDIRGIFVPSLESIFKYPKSFNDVITLDYTTESGAKYDIVFWSIWKYLTMISKYDTNAIENIFQSEMENQIIYTTDFFKGLSDKIKTYKHLINPRYLEYIYKRIVELKVIPKEKLALRIMKEMHSLDRILGEYINYMQTGKLLPIPEDKLEIYITQKKQIKYAMLEQDFDMLDKIRDKITNSIETNIDIYGQDLKNFISVYNDYEKSDILDYAYKYQLTLT